MKNLKLIFLLTIAPFWSIAQTNNFSLVEYFPAPGQHINIESVGTPQAAEQMTGEVEKMVSLGSFGGYVILKFNKACGNDTQNPYGIDFTIFGNAFDGSSEPGVIWVMQDENKNGLPDDTWYEIAGSNYFHSETKRNYGVTYYETATRDILWADDSGQSGWVKANNFNLQEYYPLPEFFADYPQDSVKFTGTLLSPAIDSSSNQQIINKAFAFGYADNHPRQQGVDFSIPDNPYTSAIEGAGGDPVDISWAVDNLGNYVELDSIHFVKIVSGALSNTGRLGEISTDVAWLADVEPGAEVSDKNELLVIYHHPEKVLSGDTLLLEANYFENGKISKGNVSYTSSDESVAEIDETGNLIAKQKGEVTISISAGSEVKTETMKVVVPDSIEILSDFSSMYPGDSVLLAANVYDNEGEKLDISLVFFSSNPGVAEIVQNNNQFWLRAIQPGEVELIYSVTGFDFQKLQTVKVLSENDKIQIYFSCKTANENVLPFQWIEVGPTEMNGFVSEREKDYSGLNRLTLFHALVTGLTKSGVNFEFRDDDAANGTLYLYSVEKDGIFTYGWGGKTDPEAFARGWIARLNNSQFINSFNNVEISNGDTVDLYHVQDITSPWIYSRLLTNKDSATINDEVELFLEQTNCIYSNREITEYDWQPVKNGEIIHDDNSWFTGADGKINVRIETNPPLTFYSANNAVLIKERITTSAEISEFSQINVYPNPVENLLMIDGHGFQKYNLKLTNLNGKVLIKKHSQTGLIHLDMKVYSPGIYLLHVLQNGNFETFKIIKK
ncbi:MAG TPA: T9SS type A sorting domain-containing protein [Tangfeifania sp.]|nr:T9SS type A sorting domain-containing protein [Tangfeifania sp.]